MPKLILTKASGWVAVGPLAAPTQFQVRRGAVLLTTEAPTDTGFDLAAGTANSAINIGTGKTVRISTATEATLQYEALE